MGACRSLARIDGLRSLAGLTGLEWLSLNLIECDRLFSRQTKDALAEIAEMPAMQLSESSSQKFKLELSDYRNRTINSQQDQTINISSASDLYSSWLFEI